MRESAALVGPAAPDIARRRHAAPAEEETAAYGIMAQFRTADDLLAAAKRAHAAGYRAMDAYTPFPVHGLAEALGQNDVRVGWIVFVAGVLGAIGGYLLQFITAATEGIGYPHNVGGRPFHSWPSFIPVTFECTVLVASFGAVIGMLAMNGLPRPHHPSFNAPTFERASLDRFYLCIEAADPSYDAAKARQMLEELGAERVDEVRQ